MAARRLMVEGEAAHGGTNWAARLRLASGLVLMAYVVTHLVNHALGLVSLEAMVRGRQLFGAYWVTPAGEALLVAAFAIHLSLGLARLWQRRTWRMPAWEAAQIVLALLIPVLGTLHVLGARYVVHCCGVTVTYPYVLRGLWPDSAWWQTAFALVVWLHGCIGLHYWLRLRPGYAAWRSGLLVLAVLVPTLGLLGFVNGAREVARRAAADPAWLRELAVRHNWPDAETAAFIRRLEDRLVGGFVLLVAGIGAAQLGRRLHAGRRNRIRVNYDGGFSAVAMRGMTLLDASRAAGVPHAAVCGGRGRCSTCRVRLVEGRERVPPASAAERAVLERVGAAADVRLACQLRLAGDLTVTRLLPAAAGTRDVMRRMDPNQGSERELVVMFADLRGFTRLAETRLPYDVVFILNRFLATMGATIERHGGHVDKFVGDGVMALFGLDDRPATAARDALAAAAAMADALAELNHELAPTLREPLRMGIALHAGPAIVGEVGWGQAVNLTAIGDTVNTASRLEALTKELGVELVVSRTVAERAGTPLSDAAHHEVELRGRRAPLQVLAFGSARAVGAAASVADRVPAPWWRRWRQSLLPIAL